ncbi:DUF3298 and DUF4163 domain-containing protein [Caulobacter sp. 17J80-11]|uniref:DUF3298 and DUF4163 domain-containing protein n=1 Tax=Caulobacter sp. 17J80-11 TaxID=2763502 RepID=UPI001653E607|nr:DUF3298 and DUF4163 domain-containing protein [Caulobacter sp. 17J80-11]MBC6983090.1 DUF3298 domain-containing protein [Caulobacter sp. 17J80-11]
MSFVRFSRVAALAAVGLVLTAGGCKRKEDKAETSAPAQPGVASAVVTPAEAAAPFSYKTTSPDAQVELTLPAALKAQPDLHAQLYAAGVKDLKAFAEGAAAERSEMAEEGVSGPPYARGVAWSTSAETSKLLSLEKKEYEYAGGAHSNSAYGALIWDKAMKRGVAPGALLRKDADFGRLDAALCAAVTRAKTERPGATPLGGEMWTCPKWRESTFVLAPSNQAGKAGGLIFLFPPYAIGPYAEGAYEVTVPYEVFAPYLAPAYADEFAGAPVLRTAEAR